MKPTWRRSRTMSSPCSRSRSTASRTRSTVARSISPRGATTSAERRRSVATSKLPGAATSPLPSSHFSTPKGPRKSARGPRFDEAGGNRSRFFALQVDRRVHSPHGVSAQTSAERIDRPGQALAVLARQVAADHRREVLEREQIARVLEHAVAPGRQLTLGREHCEHVDLAVVQALVAPRELQRHEAEALQSVDRVKPDRSFEAGLELRKRAQAQPRNVLQVGDRLEVVLAGEARQYRERVRVGERRGLEQREAALLLERLRPRVG